MDVRKIVVVVEDVDVSRKALQWSLHNLLRYGDLLTLLHVFTATKSRNKKKARLLRLQGYQLALSFKEICNSNFFNTNIEMVVTEGDQEGRKIVAMVREIGASVLVVGLHHQSFLYRLALGHDNIASSLSCRVLAIKQPELSPTPPLRAKTRERLPPLDSSTTMDFSQIEISGLQ
ncbi:UspA [Gossypium australe]|uniref:UspA n=1 Tax=Gossypium australe TaxID=47621 RepID=A0A5B6USN9_9ROSI|nr:UspA [Gossypium australe]